MKIVVCTTDCVCPNVRVRVCVCVLDYWPMRDIDVWLRCLACCLDFFASLFNANLCADFEAQVLCSGNSQVIVAMLQLNCIYLPVKVSSMSWSSKRNVARNAPNVTCYHNHNLSSLITTRLGCHSFNNSLRCKFKILS